MTRVRFAPSPTGALHIGGVRTALFNWLHARNKGGKFLLRIEDTDRERSTLESEKQILNGLSWLGLDWDEPPVRQSERSEIYQKAIDQLLANGHAYRCTCTAAEVDAMRQAQQAAGRKPMYDRRCRSKAIGPDGGGKPFVVRFATPLEGARGWDDLARGPISIPLAELDDFVIQRSDGSFIYNFVVAIDDADMGITEVIRGEDHINNTPKQMVIYEALGLPQPQFGHLPLILGPDKAPLSKRHGSTSLDAFRNGGYLPGAILNYLARLGWSHGDQEIFTLEEMIRHFDVRKVSKAGAVWNPEKFDWLNGQYIMSTPAPELMKHLTPLLPEEWKAKGAAQPERMTLLIESLRQKVKTLGEMRDQCAFAFEPVTGYEEKAAKKSLTRDAAVHLKAIRDGLAALPNLTVAEIEALFTRTAEAAGAGLGKLAQPARVALTGKGVSPGIYEVIAVLGREESLARLDAALAHIAALPTA